MDLDANGTLTVEAEEPRSGAKARIGINPNDCKNFVFNTKAFFQNQFKFLVDPSNHDDLCQHITYVESNPDYRAVCIANRQTNDPLYLVSRNLREKKSFVLFCFS